MKQPNRIFGILANTMGVGAQWGVDVVSQPRGGHHDKS